MDTQQWVLYFLLGPLMVLIATIFKAFPPKKINMLYGYRTKRSMKNQETWNEANRYANNLMIWIFMGISVVDLPIFIFLKAKHATLISGGLLTIGLIVLISVTENHLKKRFG